MIATDEQRVVEKYLSPAERGRYGNLKTPKRKLEWLAGRIAAKRLIRETRFAAERAIVPYAAISILADELGAPEVYIVGEQSTGPRISIAHSAGVAAAFRAPETGVRPGIDVEEVVKRDPGFARDFFTETEQTRAAASVEPDAQLTSIWAVKEAVLKALGIGARVDLREVEVDPDGWRVTLHGEAKRWGERMSAGSPEVTIEYEGSKRGRRVIARVLVPAERSGNEVGDAKSPEASV
jgi:4'-phosphopantetheinyl transferase